MNAGATIETTKVVARSPIYNALEEEVSAVNYSLPIKKSWDTALFHAPWNSKEINTASFNGDYWFFVGSVWNPTPYDLHQYDMTTTDTTSIQAVNGGIYYARLVSGMAHSTVRFVVE